MKSEVIFITTGERIKQARKAAGLTQAELATILGVKYQMIGQYENGKRNPKKETIQKIADALGVDYQALSPSTVIHLVEPSSISAEKYYKALEKTNVPDELMKNMKKSIRLRGIDELLDQLNDIGQEKAVEQVELLTKIPEYRKED